MKIINIMTCYNEMALLPFQHKHMKNNDIELFVIDNMSNDGTDKWLKENNISNSMLDTNECFNLDANHIAMNENLHRIKPDWFIYGDADMFYEFKGGLRGAINAADKEGFNLIEVTVLELPNTGLPIINKSPFGNYFLTNKLTIKRTLICKYSPAVSISVDHIAHPSPSIKRMNNGICFEVHACKTTGQRMETYKRRQRAWENGLNKDYGTHYISGAKDNFIVSEDNCIDIRNMPEFYLYKRLQDMV